MRERNEEMKERGKLKKKGIVNKNKDKKMNL